MISTANHRPKRNITRSQSVIEAKTRDMLEAREKRKRQSRDWFKLYIWLVERVAQNFYDERRTNTIIDYFRHSTENYFLLWRYIPTMFFFVVSNSCVLSLNWTSRSLKIGCKGKNANHRRVIHRVTFMLEQTKTDGDDSCS